MANNEETNRKPIYKKVWFWILIIVVVIGIVAVAGGKGNDTSITTGGNTNVQKEITTIGETLTTQYFKVTVDSLQKPEGGAYSKPSDGKEFVQVNLTIENISDTEYNISSVMMFDAYYDGYSVNESLSAQIADNTVSTMNGTLAAGKKMKGKLAYELPIDWKELEIDVDLTKLRFSNDGKIKIKLQNQ